MKKMKNRLLALMLTLITSTTALAEVISGSCGNDATYSYDTDSEILTIGGSGKMQNYSSKSVDGKTNVTTAPWGDYYNKISTVVISDGITSIGDRAFYGCSDLSSVTIPISVTQIGTYAFGSCTGITSMDIPNSVVQIGVGAFYGCTSLTSMPLPNSVTTIYGNAFQSCTSLTSITIPNSVDRIYGYTFAGCSSLTSVVIPNSVTNIRDYAFASCSNLGSVDIPNSVTDIGDWAFYYCKKLTSVFIPNSVTKIGTGAFYDCPNLNTVTIGKSVSTIGKTAFSRCDYLKNLILLSSTPPDVDATAFMENTFNNANVIVPRVAFDAYKSHEVWGKFINLECNTLIKVSPEKSELLVGDTLNLQVNRTADIENELITWSSSNIDVVSVDDGVIIAKTKGTATITANCGGVSATCEVTVKEKFVTGSCGENVTFVLDLSTGEMNIQGTGEMQDCTNDCPWAEFRDKIKDLNIQDGVTKIGNCAFKSCTSIVTLSISNSIIEIGQKAYQGCTALTSVRIPNSVTRIGAYAFDGCSELTSLVLDSLDISKGLHLGQHAFSNCTKLISVSLHDQFIVYGYWAFSGCTSLTSPIYNRDHLFYMPASCMGSYTVPENRYILGYSFEDSYGTTSVITPNDIGGIGNYAFCNAPSLTSITIGNSVSVIDASALKNIQNLQELVLRPITPPTVSEDQGTINAIFENYYDNVKLVVPGKSYNDYKQHEVWGKFKNIEYTTYFEVVPDQTKLVVGETTGVQVKRTPDIENESITWSSSNNDVASVNNGVITAIAEGKATITAECAGISTTFSIRVLSKTISGSCSSDGNVTYSLDTSTGVLVIEGTGYMSDYNAYSVPWYNYTDKIKTILIQEGVRSIGYHAFRNCSNLTSVIIPNSVYGIGFDAFYNCINLVSITIGSSVKDIDSNAFSKCSSLAEIIMLPLIPPYANWGFSDNIINNVKLVVPGASYYEYSQHEVWGEFKNIEYTTGIVVADCVMFVGKTQEIAIKRSPDIEKEPIVFVSSDNSIVSVNNGLLTANAEGMATITAMCAGMSATFNVIVKGKVITGSCGENVTYSIDTDTWVLTIDGSGNIFGGYLLPNAAPWGEYYDKIVEVQILGDITNVGWGAFSGMSNLKYVTISNSVVYIDFYAFYNCPNLAEIIMLPLAPPAVAQYVFSDENINSLKLVVPDDAYNEYSQHEVWGKFKNIEYASNFNGNADAINNIINTTNQQVEMYSVGGIKQNSPKRGINIVRMSDGTVKKVMVK